MKMKSMVLFAVAIAFGLVAMVCARQYMAQNQNNSEYTQVLVALTDITPGVPLDESNVAFKKWPKDAVPEGAVTTEEQYVERALKGAAVQGEMILIAKLGDQGVFGASSEIPEGMRAVTVSVDPTKTHSGQIQPGDRVDVLVTYKARTEKALVSRTKAVLEYIQVFSVDSRRASAAGETQEISAKNISLLVSPDQANLLMLAENKGMLHLALRHKSDKEQAKAAAVDDSFFDDLETGFGEFAEGEEGGNPKPKSDTVEAPDADAIAKNLERVLSGQGAPPGEPLASSPVEPAPLPELGETPIKTWKIQIYSGEEVRVEEVELPEEKPETPAEPTKVSDLLKTIQGLTSDKSS